MRVLKLTLLSLLALIVIALVAAIFVDGDIKYEKSVIINRPMEKVWLHVNSLSAINSWNPWINDDPDMKTTLQGVDGKAGALFCWSSNKNSIGRGCEEIAFINAPERIEWNLKFTEPLKSEAQSYIQLHPGADTSKTRVNWGFTGELPYPFRIIKWFTPVNKKIDKDFSKGLNSLKRLCEEK
ncbi:MAG: SRPBCC family protein [Niabella sp.]